MSPPPVRALAVLLAAIAAGCLAPDPSGPPVMASFYPIEFLAREIGHPEVTVGVVVKPGTEPHDYEPAPSDLIRLGGARLVLVQGASFEGWIETARQNDGARVVTVTDGIALRTDPHEPETPDPHVWLDPVLYAQTARNVQAALVAEFPEHASAFAQRGDGLAERLAGLHDRYEAGLADCEVRAIVTTHDAFGYLAARYDVETIPISGLDPEAEPTPGALQEVVEQMRERNITVVYFEDLVSPRVAEAVARETGATTRVLSPIEGIAPDDAAAGADYFSRMDENLDALRAGMRCK